MLDFISNKLFYMPIFYITIGVICYFIISIIINKVSKINIKMKPGINKRRTTIISLIKNIIKYIIAIIIIILILNLYGVNTTSIIASLGVISLIIGLAFQDIIKDFLAGIFIIFDNEYAVGDWVQVNGFTGEVISLGLKTTQIKAYTGEVKSISNSAFTEVINYNLYPDNLYMEIPCEYSTKVEEIEEILKNVETEIRKHEDVIDVVLLGVNSFEESFLMYAIAIECKAMSRFAVKRQTLKLIKAEVEAKGLSIPISKMNIIQKK